MTTSAVPMSQVMDSFFDGPHATPRPAPEGPVYLGIKNLTEDGRLDLSETRHIAWDDFPRWTKRVEPQPGDVVFTYEASLHRYALIPPGFKGCLGRRIALIRPDKSKVNARFLLYYFLSPGWRSTLTSRINIGSTVDRVPLIDFPNFPIDLPSLGVQRKVASIISAYDELIENNLRRIEILEEMAQTIYREWFVNLHGDEEVELETSPLGPIPRGWATSPLSSVADARRGLSWNRDQETDDAVAIGVLTIPNIRQHLDPAPRTRLAGLSQNDLKTFSLEEHDVLMIGSNGNPQRVGQTVRIPPGVDALFASFLMRIRPIPGAIDPSLLFHQLRDSRLTGQLRAGAVGSTGLRNIRITALRDALVLIPPAPRQEDFGRAVGPMRELVDVLHRQSAALGRSKDLLLPRLISGEIDVSELDIDTSWLAA